MRNNSIYRISFYPPYDLRMTRYGRTVKNAEGLFGTLPLMT